MFIYFQGAQGIVEANLIAILVNKLKSELDEIKVGDAYMFRGISLHLSKSPYFEFLVRHLFEVNALVICNHAPGVGRGIAVEMSGTLTKVLPQQCGGNTGGLLYIGKKDGEMKR